jgi:hypothetical protein
MVQYKSKLFILMRFSPQFATPSTALFLCEIGKYTCDGIVTTDSITIRAEP